MSAELKRDSLKQWTARYRFAIQPIQYFVSARIILVTKCGDMFGLVFDRGFYDKRNDFDLELLIFLPKWVNISQLSPHVNEFYNSSL